jgi:hypothetical protein
VHRWAEPRSTDPSREGTHAQPCRRRRHGDRAPTRGERRGRQARLAVLRGGAARPHGVRVARERAGDRERGRARRRAHDRRRDRARVRARRGRRERGAPRRGLAFTPRHGAPVPRGRRRCEARDHPRRPTAHERSPNARRGAPRARAAIPRAAGEEPGHARVEEQPSAAREAT